MRYYRKNKRFVSLVLLATLLLSSCTAPASKEKSDAGTTSAESGGDGQNADPGTVDLVSNAVDFDHVLDQYEPKKDHYNFYFTYKTAYSQGQGF